MVAEAHCHTFPMCPEYSSPGSHVRVVAMLPLEPAAQTSRGTFNTHYGSYEKGFGRRENSKDQFEGIVFGHQFSIKT